MAKRAKRVWIGNVVWCDVCRGPFGNVMYDARTQSGQWGNLCQGCFKQHGEGLGEGKGQKYRRQKDGTWAADE